MKKEDIRKLADESVRKYRESKNKTADVKGIIVSDIAQIESASKKKISIDASVNSSKITMEFDTASYYSLISYATFCKLQVSGEIKPTIVSLNAYNKLPIKIKGCV